MIIAQTTSLLSGNLRGKSIRYMGLLPGARHHFFSLWPIAFEERGLEAMLFYAYEDCKVLENSFALGFMMRVLESTDIIGTTVKCLRLVTPHFKSTADVVTKEIMQLPTQDFSCLPLEVANANVEQYWNDIHTTFAGWFRPDPLCCQGYEHNVVPSCRGGESINGRKLRLSSIFPEPVGLVFLQRHISLSEYSNQLQGSATRYVSSSLKNYPPLKLGISFVPHYSDEPNSTSEGSVTEVIDGEKQHLTHVNYQPDQLDEMLLPKAIEYLYHNTEATSYVISWRSNHGRADLSVSKTTIATRISGARIASTRQGTSKRSKMLREILQGQTKNLQWKEIARRYLKLWVVRSSERLQSMFTAWLSR
ncbi:uncharacterized protein LOC104582951 isoform X2 [Brachypodium distachyon]|uniref:uncharacterized protein LOC104582951 isoform X2 n=1 Tax=Brachypodium distachyon TaxID=15368 RepID=UPI00071D1908|nr:uncharacterized protein LOC104582951 isoform X2 [Brachypodium distachyon]|eukprot:XP_014753730.1 uncharacterized protein LOC104582951 isoform X2 [Brachypodium distachyon]